MIFMNFYLNEKNYNINIDGILMNDINNPNFIGLE